LTPLHLAARHGHCSVVKYFVKLKANISSKDKWGRTPLRLANENEHNNIAKYLKIFGAEEDHQI